MIDHQPTNNNQRAPSAAAGLASDGDELTRAPISAGSGVGISKERIRRPEHRAKAEAFWKRLGVLRRTPGHCCRCGKPHTATTRQCPKCLAYQARYRGHLGDTNKKVTATTLVAAVKQCRREVSKLREIIKQMQRARRADYQRGYLRGRQTGIDTGRYGDSLPASVSFEELRGMSHVYDSQT